MRIAFVSDWFSEKMGYAENALPKAMVSLGHEIHLITSTTQPYFDSPMYRETYEPFIGPGIVDCGSKPWDGYMLHRLPHGRDLMGRVRIKGLVRKLRDLRPDVVQTFETASQSTMEVVLAKPILGYRLFVESHIHASVFSKAMKKRLLLTKYCLPLYRATLGTVTNLFVEKCYPISEDAADIVTEFFGLRKDKVEVVSLGVDTDLFHPPDNPVAQQTRERLREQLGWGPSEIVCIYTGRLSSEKGALLLAHAVAALVSKGARFRGLFVGGGKLDDGAAIRERRGCVVHSFVPSATLSPYYWAADIGVWPKQESTSQLDAIACGIPIVISNSSGVLDRVHGNGLTYEEDNVSDLVRQLEFLEAPAVRRRMGKIGSTRARESYSWHCIAEKRLRDYESALGN